MIDAKDKRGRHVWVEIVEDESGKWHWMMWSGNGRPIATNPLPYDTQKLCVQAIRAVCGAAGQAKHIVKVHPEGKK